MWEKQKRGLAHMHGVLSVSTPAELRWAEVCVEALADLAPSKGFGSVDRWEKICKKIKPGIEAAAYLSGYFVNGKGRKASLTENVQDPDLPRSRPEDVAVTTITRAEVERMLGARLHGSAA